MIYFDHHAATPLCERARAAMHAAASSSWANPSSVHGAGRAARAHLEQARRAIAAAFGAQPADLVLTSGGTEACNLALRGLLHARGGHVVTSAVEHPAVARTLERLEAQFDLQLTRLALPEGQAPSAAELAAALRSETRLCAIQWVNHETGTLLPIAQYASVCRSAGVPLFVDATQAAGKLPIDVGALGVDLLAIASHKLGGPAGAGALWVRRGLDLEPVIAGGAQERGRRAGSPDVAGTVGFGAACEALGGRLADQPRLATLRGRLEALLVELGARVNAPRAARVATVSNTSLPGWTGAELVAALDLEGLCAASGAACSSGLSGPSPVLLAMYAAHAAEAWRAGSALRLSFGPETTEIEVEIAAGILRKVISRRAG